jgi:hypothetical protein
MAIAHKVHKPAGFGFSWCNFCEEGEEAYLPRPWFRIYEKDGGMHRACPDCIIADRPDDSYKLVASPEKLNRFLRKHEQKIRA